MEVVQNPSVIVHPHAVLGTGTTHTIAEFQERETLGAYIKRTGVIVPAGQVVVWHNGYRVPTALWRKLIPKTGDQVIIRAKVRGGGGGGKMFRTIAMIALMVVAVYTGQVYGAALAAKMGIGTAAATGLITGTIMIGGSLLINALLPPPSPTLDNLGTGQKYESSPTYTISGGRNSARLWEPMTVIFGRHKVVPDLGAKYYTEYVGDTQYLNQMFHFGLQADTVTLSEFKIGDTPITDYQGVEIQISGEDGKLTMFPGNVDTIEGFVFNYPDGWISRTTSKDVTHINVDLAAQLFSINDNGAMTGRTIEVQIEFRPVGGAWQSVGMLNDAIYATHYWAFMVERESWGDGESPQQYTTTSQYMYGSTNYADHTPGEREVIRQGYCDYDVYGNMSCYQTVAGYWQWTPHPHSQGRPWAGIAPDPLIGHSIRPGIRLHGARQELTRQTISIPVAKGQYEVRVRKLSGDVKDSRNSNEVAVSQILCFQTDEADYTGQLRVALRIKATNQLNGAIDEFSAIASARAPVWDGSQFNIELTRNPAWWFLMFARGKRKASGERVYGAGFSANQIDEDAIRAWALWCDEKGLTFDYVLDQKKSTAEMLQIIARAGRASPTWQSGKLGVVWDAENLPVVGMFGPFNIKAGTFKVAYISEGTVDEIVANFINPERNWEMDEVRVKVPGATASNNPLQLDLEGFTNHVTAGQEANLLAASQIWHRRRITWETDFEGWIASRGDVVQISHDLTVWGYSGRLLGREGQQIQLSQQLPSGTGTMMLRDPDGNMKTITVTGGNDADVVTITSDMSDFALPGDAGYEDVTAVDWAFFFDPMETPGRRFKITEVNPTMDGVEFSAIDDDPGYYASINNPYQYMPPRDGALLGGVVLGVTVSESIYDMPAQTFSIQFDWVLSSAAKSEVIVSVNGAPRPPVLTEDRSISIIAKRGDDVSVNITPVHISGNGSPETHSHTVVGAIHAPTRPLSMLSEVVGSQIRLSWTASPDVWVTGYEVRDSDSGWGTPGQIFRGDALSSLVEPSVPGTPTTWYVRAINAAGLYSDDSASTAYTVSLPNDPTNVTATFADTSLTTATVTLDWVAADPVFGLDYYRVTYGSVVKLAKSTTITLPADWIGNREFTIQTVDMLGNESMGLVTNIEKLTPLPPMDVRAQVIDNNVLLYWALPQRTTLPIDHVLVKEGETWAAGSEVGTKKGSFTSLSELMPGHKRYWLATIDTDGWESDPVSIDANVSEPPDFIFRGEIHSDFEGTITNGALTQDGVILPVNDTETWQQHFSDRSWASPQDQVNDGYPIYIQPTLTTGVYVEVFDFGTVVPSSRADVVTSGVVVAGNPTIEQTVQTSQDGVTWSSPVNGTSVFATNFRYVRYTLRVIQVEDRAIYRLNGVVVTLSTKLKNDGGNTDCLSSDTNGTIANFNMTFIDVSSITLTPAGTIPKTAVYDFKDAMLSGTYSIVSGTATVNASGHDLLPGQDVMLLYANRDPQRATVQTATTNSFTALVDGPNKSGNLQIYSQSMRIYLFDANGSRASGSVSWAIKGN